jgi:predicted deacylase
MRLYEFIVKKHDFHGLKSKFEKVCLNNNCSFEVLSKDSEGDEIFCCRTPDTGGKKICVISGLHGDEPGGPFGILDFFNRKNIKNLKNNLLLIPVMNPSGLMDGKREDGKDRDLNRVWNRREDKEPVRSVKEVILEFAPDMLLSLHEDDNADGFYLYPSEGCSGGVIKWFKDFLHTKFDSISNKTVYGDKVKNGVVVSMSSKPKHYASMEKFFEKSGIPNVTLEIPGGIPLLDRKRAYGDLLVNFLNYIR